MGYPGFINTIYIKNFLMIFITSCELNWTYFIVYTNANSCVHLNIKSFNYLVFQTTIIDACYVSSYIIIWYHINLSIHGSDSQ